VTDISYLGHRPRPYVWPMMLSLLSASIMHVATATPVPLVPERWTVYRNHSPEADTTLATQFAPHLGRPSLIVPDGIAIAKDIDITSGTIEADVATDPKGMYFGLAFHVASADRYEIIFFRPHSAEGAVQYAPSFFNMNEWKVFPGREYVANLAFPSERWTHLRIVIRGLVAAVYLDTATTPTIEVHDLALGATGGAIGFWGRGGGGYLSNLRYEPDHTPYASTPTRQLAVGALTNGWTLSEALPRSTTNPDMYPRESSLHWQSVPAEREGMVFIGRYRRNPRVDPPDRSMDGPSPPSPGMQVAFARTTISSDHDRTVKMWVGYSDDIVVFLNGQPLYAGRNSMIYRDPRGLGWFYPYADAVFLPLRRGTNELLLAVSESFGGWAFLCRFDAPVPGVRDGERPE
jgi:hypothetical protein